jgi:hypothetical protein
MAGWKFQPVTYDGVAVNDGVTYRSHFQFEDANMQLVIREPQEITIPGDYSFPESLRSQVASARLVLHIDIVNTLQVNLDGLRRLFDRLKGFVVLTVIDDSGNTWSLNVKCTRLIENTPISFEAHLYTNRPILESSIIVDTLRSITASGATFDPAVTVGGTVRNYPLFDLVGTVAKTNANDYNRRWQVTIAWRSEFPGEDSVGNGYPIDIANDTLDTLAEVTATRMKANGDDLRVYVDGVEYPRLLDGINTTSTKVWVPIHFSPGMHVTLADAITGTGGDPANGESQAVNEDLTGWPERGYFVVDNECIWYGSRTTESFDNIKRAQRGTAGATHLINATCDWVEHDIQIVSNYTAAANPPVPLLAILASSSTNLAHTYPGGGTGTFFNSSVQRYGQMRAKYTADNVRASNIIMGETGTVLQMVEAAPGSAFYYPYNNVELYVPCGVKVAASAIAFDITQGTFSVAGADVVLNARVFGVDVATGVEQLLATYDRPNRGTGKTLTPSAVLSRIRLNAIYAAITGAYRGDAFNALSLSNTGHGGGEEDAQGFVLDQDSWVTGLSFFGKESASGDDRIALAWIKRADGAGNSPGTDEIQTKQIIGSKFTTAGAWVSTDAFQSPGYLIGAGTKFFNLVGSTGSGTIHAHQQFALFGRGSRWVEDAGAWADQGSSDIAFLILGDGSVVQPEAPSSMGGYIQWDNITVTFDDTNLRTPKIVRAPQETIYIHRERIQHEDAPGDNDFNVFYIAAVGQEITVDARRKEVIIDDARGIYAPNAVTPDDPEQWFYLLANNSATGNTIRVVDATMGGGSTLTVQMSRNDAWA